MVDIYFDAVWCHVANSGTVPIWYRFADPIVLSYMTYKIWGHTPSNPTFYFDPAKKTEHNRFDGTSSYNVTALFLESLVTAYRCHIRTQMENSFLLYIQH